MSHEHHHGPPVERLRSPDRVARLEVPRVVDLSLEGPAGNAARRMLDVGTGTGIFAEAFRDRGLEVTGIDPNTDMLAAARRMVSGVTFTEGTAESLPFPDRAFDLVFLSHVLHETADPLRALSEARRVASARVVVLELPYVDDDKGPPLSHRLRPSEIEGLAARAGFPVIERIDLAHLHLFRLTT